MDLHRTLRLLWGLFLCVCLFKVVCGDESYYQLLGVSKEASNKEIRQAFKKLALVLHPDKNPNDPSAHDSFLKINRAYEVLKDEDLRKKYDRYGEKGLQDGQQGGRYESWSFYRYDFGIYDEDLEIITLDREDFEGAVNSGELWFVNFYFPRCSHCHDLAPTWREFAKEMDGVLRIGAVNCGDNTRLCRSRGISSYPSLYLFRTGMNTQKFFGDRTKENLMKFAMQFVNSRVLELWEGNVHLELQHAVHTGIGWLITFCADTGDCLGSQTRQKLSGMLEGLVRVGWMDCATQAELCDTNDILSSFTAYFPPGSSLRDRTDVVLIQSLEAREIYSQVIQQMPELERLAQETFQDAVRQNRWLVTFSYGRQELMSNEYKKLRVLLKDAGIQVGMVDCVSDVDLCRSLYMLRPGVAVFKGRGVNDFEVYHGKELLYNIVAFAKDSTAAHVTTLAPETFPRQQKEPWLVDFFAPWCPPCRALLPELRKASVQLFGQIKFGTLDCTVHGSLCSTYNIQAYPTTIILNQSSVHEYEGRPSADGILEFVEELVNPSVEVLTPQTFGELVGGRREAWLVDFFAPWCGPCQALTPEWRRVARMLARVMRTGSVDCQAHRSFCQSHDVRSYPEIRLYPQDTKRLDHYLSYNGWHRDAHSLRAWALSSLPRVSVDLSPEDFRSKVLDGEMHWVVDFYAPWCGPCQHFAPEFELLAQMVKGSVSAGKVDCQAYAHTCQSAGIRAYPSVRFYPHMSSSKRDQGGESINSRDADTIVRILQQRLQQLSPRLKGSASTMKDEL